MDRTYFPVLLLLGFVVANAVLMLGLSHLTLRPRPRRSSRPPYESGIPPLGDARERFSVKFYMVAMLFIIFDIETVFMIPWGAYYRQLSCRCRSSNGILPGGTDLVLRPRRDARVHRDPARRLRLRLEEGSAAMGLSPRPEHERRRVRPAVAGRAGSRRGSTSSSTGAARTRCGRCRSAPRAAPSSSWRPPRASSTSRASAWSA